MSTESSCSSPEKPVDQSPEGSSPDKDLERVLRDFIQDVVTTFPETKDGMDADLRILLDAEPEETCVKATEAVRAKLTKVYPEKFFDILYQNDELFSQDTELYLLPGIDFRTLWTSNITEATRQTMWKYLQLVLFTLVASMKDGASFGDTAKLFEAIDPEEFRGKLEETISEMQDCFEEEKTEGGDEVGDDDTGTNLPDPESLHEHVKTMMGGKLGQLAREIAEEAARDLGIDPDIKDPRAAFKTLLKDPLKLMSLVKKVGGKLNEKIKSGEIKEAELLKEATEIVQRMRDMPGMGGIESLLRKRAGGAKPDLAAMQSHLQRNTRMASQRDRMRAKLAERQRTAAAPAPPTSEVKKKEKREKGEKKKRRKKKKAK